MLCNRTGPNSRQPVSAHQLLDCPIALINILIHPFLCRCDAHVCLNCRVPWHEGQTCEEHCAERFLDGDVPEDMRALWQLIDSGIVQLCPACGAPTEKRSGCDAVRCGHCGRRWVWEVRVRWRCWCVNNGLTVDAGLISERFKRQNGLQAPRIHIHGHRVCTCRSIRFDFAHLMTTPGGSCCKSLLDALR